MDLQIRALGPFAVQRKGWLLTPHEWVTHKTQQLFKILLTHRGHTVLKDQLMEWLWPDLAPKNAANSLRVAVAHLRRALEPSLATATQSRWIISRPNGYLLRAADMWLDVEAFLEKIKEAAYWRERERPDLALSAYRAAAELYRGDYLEEDRYEDWALSTREQLREAFFELRRDWADLLAEQHRYGEALALCQHLLRDYPIREEIWQMVMRFYAAAGQRDQALRAYEQCKAILRREFEADPLPETQAVYEEIVTGKAKRSDAAPSSESGRIKTIREESEGEIKQSPTVRTLKDLLDTSGLRMAVLTGAGSAATFEAFLNYARENGATVLRASGSPLKKTLSFSVLLEALPERSPTKIDGLLPFRVPSRVGVASPACPAECEYARLLGGLCAELSVAIGSAQAILALENLEHIDDATYQVLCHWALLAAPSDLFILGTRTGSLRSFWASELMTLSASRTIACEGATATNCHSDPNVPDLVTVLEWAHRLYATLRRWEIDPSGWFKLCDHFQQKLFQLSDHTSELSFLWYRFNGPWPEGGEAWALNSYRCLLAQRGFVERTEQISIPRSNTGHTEKATEGPENSRLPCPPSVILPHHDELSHFAATG